MSETKDAVMTETEAFRLMLDVLDCCGTWAEDADCAHCPLKGVDDCHDYLFDAIRRAHG